ncbi:glycoside hydrolase family 53 protein [Piromyces sp. E2]|nr:glycoside hydrolase family 53 protein [Piromyces sp. E2]|eukprot:OUM57500.1 glycoside hydrolase family 53 protein [Piromyces sp. E2]
MKAYSFLFFIINVVLFSTVISAKSFDPNDIEWLDIAHWNETDFSKLQKRSYENQVKNVNFYRGVDVSSIISLENSGIRFYNSNGQQQDLFEILANVGVNCIRVRIWNTPKTTSGKIYGGGNNDLEVAKTIGSRAAKYGLPLFVDFHYSDFWADPGKQSIPKDWKNFDLDKRVFEIYKFTKGCLEWLLENGSLISMVQIGNETTCFMCGDKNMNNVMKMMSNGAKAVRDINRNILIALHFTNPNKSDTMLWYASQLASGRVDYDVFATSYYPYWHGTLDNLKWTLNEVANRYNKKVLIAEYSYPYTNAAKTSDGNNYGSVYQGLKDTNFRYPISVDGQEQCIKDIYSTMKSTKNGIGAFYWEPAWIAPQARNDAERKQIWEQYGSGWATTAAAEYDSSANRLQTGGTSWDNQAVFDQNGKALKSIWALGEKAPQINQELKKKNI